MGVLDEAVEDGIRQCRVAASEGRMPRVDRQLADHQCRADLAAVIDDLEQVFRFDDVGWRQ